MRKLVTGLQVSRGLALLGVIACVAANLPMERNGALMERSWFLLELGDAGVWGALLIAAVGLSMLAWEIARTHFGRDPRTAAGYLLRALIVLTTCAPWYWLLDFNLFASQDLVAKLVIQRLLLGYFIAEVIAATVGIVRAYRASSPTIRANPAPSSLPGMAV